jgi:hypothetical protein
MSANIDYMALAIITIFTSFFSGLGKELAEAIISFLKKRKEHLAKTHAPN